MKAWSLFWLLVPCGSLILIGRWLWTRKHRWDGPTLRQQLAHWDRAEPKIPRLALPAVRPLQGRGLDGPDVSSVLDFSRRGAR